MTKILPPNASKQEIVLAKATDYRCEPDGLRGFKFDPSDEVLPWLIWEYGLGELTPYFDDPRQLISEGVKFQRLKSTPAALKMALSWIDLKCDIEEEPPGAHYAEFQLDLSPRTCSGVHKNIENICELAKLAIPVRSRLSRIYNRCYDIRRFILSESPYGNMLSDHSGIRTESDGPKLSFGRNNQFAVTAGGARLSSVVDRTSFSRILSEDIYRLDFAVLGETPPHIENSKNDHQRLSCYFNDNYNWPFESEYAGLFHNFNTYAKAQIILSDGEVLGDLNCCFPMIWDKEDGDTFEMDNQQLSEQAWSLQYSPITERSESTHNQTTFIDVNTETMALNERENVFTNMLDTICLGISESDLCFKVTYESDSFWHHHRHMNQHWTQQYTTGSFSDY